MTAREAPPSFNPPYWDATAPAPRFKTASRVRVLTGAPVGHTRTPSYVRGRVGVVERVVGHFANPEELAYGRSGAPTAALYRVRFAIQDLWPDAAPSAAVGREDTLDVEIYESWLEPFFDYQSDFSGEISKVERDLAERPRASS